MQVEITPQNIIKYNLVQLTGNSAEEMMRQAAEAHRNGYTLSCRIPDTDEHLEQNIFEAAGSQPADMTSMESVGAVIEGGRIDDIAEERWCPSCQKYKPTKEDVCEDCGSLT